VFQKQPIMHDSRQHQLDTKRFIWQCTTTSSIGLLCPVQEW